VQLAGANSRQRSLDEGRPEGRFCLAGLMEEGPQRRVRQEFRNHRGAARSVRRTKHADSAGVQEEEQSGHVRDFPIRMSAAFSTHPLVLNPAVSRCTGEEGRGHGSCCIKTK
jgi:hypothetical protein